MYIELPRHTQGNHKGRGKEKGIKKSRGREGNETTHMRFE